MHAATCRRRVFEPARRFQSQTVHLPKQPFFDGLDSLAVRVTFTDDLKHDASHARFDEDLRSLKEQGLVDERTPRIYRWRGYSRSLQLPRRSFLRSTPAALSIRLFPLDKVAEANRAMDERRAIKTLLRP
jgi:hypothetical protein